MTQESAPVFDVNALEQPCCFYSEFVKSFLEEGGADILEEYDQDQARWHALTQILSARHAQGESVYDGLTIQSTGQEKWAVITRGFSEEEPYRYTVFDMKGFAYHSSHLTAHDALIDAFESGFQVYSSPDTLDEISQYWPATTPQHPSPTG